MKDETSVARNSAVKFSSNFFAHFHPQRKNSEIIATELTYFRLLIDHFGPVTKRERERERERERADTLGMFAGRKINRNAEHKLHFVRCRARHPPGQC